MKADWDRRIRHDYRFWMSDGVASDEVMWETGRRDYKILVEGLQPGRDQVFFELGCGVGRILAAALEDFGAVVGLDVSEEAIRKAAELLPQDERLELVAGDGYSLAALPDSCVDVAVSFAAITSMPTEVIANYLVELYRVLKPGRLLRIQIYLGEEQSVATADTLHIRCFKRENFLKGVAAAGYDVEWINELILPFQVSFKELGLETFVASLKKSDRVPESPKKIASLLLPSGEPESPEGKPVSPIEFWMAYNYAKTLIASGDFDRAREALAFAADVSKATALDVSDLLAEIVQELENKEKMPAREVETVGQSGALSSGLSISPELFEKNEKALREYFPEIAAALQERCDGPVPEIQDTEEGRVLYFKGQCLDHPSKPKAGAAAWVKRSLSEERFRSAEQLVVYGLGAGYHVEALLNGVGEKPVSVIEPSWAVFRAALGTFDLTKILPRLRGLSVGENEIPGFFDAETEMILRPQTQTLSPDYAARVKSSFYGKRGISSLLPSIGVLGPLQGGTLPMAGYTARAFEILRQRTRRLDVSGFALGYHQFASFVNEKITQAILQSRYVEMISNTLIEAINEKPVDILVCMAQAPVTPAFLTEMRRRGIITVLWFVEDYLRFTYWQHTAQYYDFIFTIQKGRCIDLIKAAGGTEVHYLPCACDPGIHKTVELSAEERQRWGSAISFVGAGYHNRQQTFASLAEMPFKIWGTEWPTCAPFDRLVQEEGRRLTPEEYVKIFNATTVNINLHSSDERDGVDPYGDFVNPRTFELAATGVFQLCDSRSLLPELFEPGKEIITFDSAHELKDKINHYLAYPEERDKIVGAAHQRAISDHTYAHRMKEMLSIIYSTRYETLKSRIGTSPWKKMIERARPHAELHGRCVKAYERGEEPILDGLVSDIMTDHGKLSETEQKLLFLFHVRKQIIRMTAEEAGKRQ